jgi:quercetin dioxygenase-like cupin family protein
MDKTAIRAAALARGRIWILARLTLAIVLTASFILVAGRPAGKAQADEPKVTAQTSKALGQFDAAALLSPGPQLAIGSLAKYPAGTAFVDNHVGLRLVYDLAGTTQVTDGSGTVVHHAGDFWVEASGDNPGVIGLTDTSTYILDIVPIGALQTDQEPSVSSAVQRTALGTIDATGLLPSGPLTGVASLVTFPTGFMQKHYHGGSRFVYQLSGTIRLDDAAGTQLHGPGYFFDEPRGHIHTATVIAQATNLVVDFLTPGAKSTYPIVAAVPLVTHSTSGASGSFTVTFSSKFPGNGMVLFGSGPGCSGLVETAMSDSGAGTTSHSVKVTGNDLPGTVGDIGIVPGATYWFETETATRIGNEVDNNEGKCYSVTVPSS